MKKILLFVIILVVIFFVLIPFLGTYYTKKNIDIAKDSAAKEKAKLIVKSFETAYNSAYLKAGTNPTLEMVSQEFNVDSAETKLENGILKIKSNFGVECETKKEDQGIYLYCLSSDKKDSLKSERLKISS